MPQLFAEIRRDLAEHSLSREFIVMKKSWSYWSKGYELVYYYDEHPDLDSKLRTLENLGLVQEIAHNNVKRFNIADKLAEYLLAPPRDPA